MYQELYLHQRENPSVRAKLVELHFRLGNTEKAGEHLEALTELSGWTASHPGEEAVVFHRHLLDLGIEDFRITAEPVDGSDVGPIAAWIAPWLDDRRAAEALLAGELDLGALPYDWSLNGPRPGAD